MATLNLDVGEFENLMLIVLFDSIMNPEQVRNEVLKDFISKNSSRIKPSLIKSYLDSDSEMRFKYKRIKGIFDGSDTSIQQIRIGPMEEVEKEKKKEGIIKKVIKKILKKEEISVEDINMLTEIDKYI